MAEMKLLDIVVLWEYLPEINLYRSQVETIFELYEPGIVEVEFRENNGRAYAMTTLKEKQLMLLYDFSCL